MMVDTFGEKGGWDINKGYKVKDQFMLDMYLKGHMIQYKYYGNKFSKKDFYEKARKAIDAIINTYGNQITRI